MIWAVLDILGNCAARGIAIAMCGKGNDRRVGTKGSNDVGCDAKGGKADKFALRHCDAAHDLGQIFAKGGLKNKLFKRAVFILSGQAN